MTETKRSMKTFKGAVLIMVLTVTFVLIIMLLATLTVVSTANQRSYLKFEENQAYYTARSALDAYTLNLLNDAGYYVYDTATSKKQFSYSDDLTKPTPTRLYADMTQGLALQLDLYKIGAQNDLRLGSNFFEDDYVFGTTTAWAEDENFSASGSKLARTATDLGTDLQEIIYTVKLPVVASGTNKYGKMADTVDGTITSDEHDVDIKVEVLERRYNMSTGYDDEDLLNAGKPGTHSTKGTSYPSEADVKKAIKEGDRSKDTMKIKVTSTAVLMGVEGTATLIYDTSESMRPSASKAVTSLSDLTGADSFTAVGGVATMLGDLETKNNGSVTGPVFVRGNVNAANSGRDIVIQSDYSFVTLGNYVLGNDAPTVQGKGGILYVNGDFIFTGGTHNVGDATNHLNVITNEVKLVSNANKIYGNLYSNKFDYIASSGVIGASQFLQIGKTYINTVLVDKSHLTVDSGSFQITLDATVDGHLNTAFKDFHLGRGFEYIDGADKYAYLLGSDGKLHLNLFDITTNEYILVLPDVAYDFVGSTNLSRSNEVNVEYNNGAHYGYTLNADAEKEFTLPADLIGGTKSLIVPTIQSLYGEYFHDVSPVTGAQTFIVESSSDSSTHGHGGEFAGFNIDAIKNDIADAEAELATFFNTYSYEASSWYEKNTPNPLEPWNFTKTKVTDPGQIAIIESTEGVIQNKISNANNQLVESVITAVDKYNNSLNDPSLPEITFESVTPGDADIPSSFTQVITASGILKPDVDYGMVAIDARLNDIVIQLGDGTKNSVKYQGCFIVYGDKEVTFTLPESTTGAHIKYQLDTTEGKYFRIVDSKLIDNISTVKNDAQALVLNLGPKGTTPAPKIYFYSGKDTTVSLGTKGFMTAYIYAPHSAVNIEGANNDVKYKYKYTSTNDDTYTYTGDAGLSIIGSVFCGSYSSGQKVGVAYIDQGSDGVAPGAPHLSWKPYQYVRK